MTYSDTFGEGGDGGPASAGASLSPEEELARRSKLKGTAEEGLWGMAREYEGVIGTRQEGLEDIGRATDLARDHLARQTGRATAGAFGNAGQMTGGGGQAAMMRDTGLAAASQMGQFESEQMERARLQKEAIQQARIEAEQAMAEGAAGAMDIATTGSEQREVLTRLDDELYQIAATSTGFWGDVHLDDVRPKVAALRQRYAGTADERAIEDMIKAHFGGGV